MLLIDNFTHQYEFGNDFQKTQTDFDETFHPFWTDSEGNIEMDEAKINAAVKK